MNQDNITINSLNPSTFEYQTYSDADTQLIVQSELDTVFSKDTDYIEYYVYDQTQTLIYPGATVPLLEYDVRDGDVLLNPKIDLINTGYDLGTYNILYSFYRKRLASDIELNYFISSISSDRTEIRLDSNIINNDLIISSSNSFIQYRENAEYFVDFYLNFGLNQTVIANNIKLETEEGVDPTVLIKLYEPLPSNFNLKDELWVVEELSTTQAYEVFFPFDPIIEDDFTYIAGPNYNLNITQASSQGGESFSFDTLLQSNVTSSVNQIKNLLNQKEININVNYESYSNFVHFSSAKVRLENFYYKVGLIESASNQLSGFLDEVTSQTRNTLAFSSSKASITGQIDSIVKNFDGYEYFLYFNSGSKYSYPKLNTEPPFILAATGSIQTLEWIGNAAEGTTYYGGQALSASNYDQDNRNWLYWAIPEYLRDDPANERYELFVDMVAQYYDNVWVYTKDISNKFDADNRLDYGIAKDLVSDAIRDFGVKLYSSNFNTNDLFTAFLGITPSGSSFPFPQMTGSVVDGSGDLAIPTGFEYVDTQISASNDIVPLNDVQNQLYKRIYHNIPYLLKTKGTVAGIRALITSYGIPDTILRISEFGGKDRNESQDYDLKQDVFNYAYNTGVNSINYISSSFSPNSKFNPYSTGAKTSPNTVQFRFKSSGIPPASNNIASSDIRYSQSLWLSDDISNSFNNLASAVVLEYTGSGFVSSSYSGSIASPYDTWGVLKFYPDLLNNPTVTCSVSAPFFNEDWWSVQFTATGSGTTEFTGSLFAANEINGKIGFTGSEVKNGLNSLSWYDGDFAALNINGERTINSKIYEPFSGSFQEYRMFVPRVSESRFFDYTVNPYSNEGNGINSTPDQQIFRAALGTQLDTGSRTSIHPRVTGSTVQITQSFGNTSTFYTSSAKWVTNVEDIFQDQVPAGIKNRITNKIQAENLILAEAPYGFQTTTSSTATISNTTSDVISPMESIQQQSFVSQSYTPNVNYLEVGFSPSNQINDDINAQLGYFNLGDYIGDPRFISSSLDSYPNLDRLRDAYFEKYIKGYDIVDFIRLIKFFDNSLFKMIKDFTPARTSLASGVIVKQHLLERNRKTPPQATSSLHDYEGLVVNLPKNYSSGSSDFPQYSTEGSAIYKFTGGTGGSFERYNGLSTSPSGSKGLGPDNRFFLTQSWSESADFSIIDGVNFNQSNSFYISASGGAGKFPGSAKWVHSDQSEFYDGIFSGSTVVVATQSLNEACSPYLKVSDTDIIYNPIYYSFSDVLDGSVTSETFIDSQNIPSPGVAWIGSSLDINSNSSTTSKGLPVSTVKFIKLANLDVNGISVGEYVAQNTTIGIGTSNYFIQGVTNFGTHVLLNIDSTLLNANVTSSIPNGGQQDFTLVNARGTYSSSTTSDNTSQNIFARPQTTQQQVIYNWSDLSGETIGPGNVPITDVQGFFNTGAFDVTTQDIIDNPGIYDDFGSFYLEKTPNAPLFFECQLIYSSSDTLISNIISSSGIYHSASNNPSTAFDQGFTLIENSVFGGSYIPAPFTAELDTNFFTPYNGGIPGNSASWYPTDTHTVVDGDKPNLAALAGHPQLTFPGTASFDFYFPSFTFNQQSTPVPNALGSNTSLSGSTANTANDAFNYTTGGIPASTQVNDIINTRTALDGAIGIKQRWLTKNADQLVYQANIGGVQPVSFDQIQAVVQYTLVAPTGTNVSASAYNINVRNGSTPTGTSSPSLDVFSGGNLAESATGTGLTLGGGNPGGSTSTPWATESSISGEWQFTGSFNASDMLSFYDSGITRDPYTFNISTNTSQIAWFKPAVLGLESGEFDYGFKNFKIVFQYQVLQNDGSTVTIQTGTVNGNGFNWSPTPNSNYQNPISDGDQNDNSNEITLRNNAALRVGNAIDITARLMKLSGSADSTNGNTPFIPQLIKQSGTVPYTMTPGTSDSGTKFNPGSGLIDTYTETVTFTDSPILGILQPYHAGYWPTLPSPNPTGGNGSTINEAGDIYYIEYSMSNFTSPNANFETSINFNQTDNTLGITALPNPSDNETKLLITQSIKDVAGGFTFASSSIAIYKTTPTNASPIGDIIISEEAFNTTSKAATGKAKITGSIDLGDFDYALGDGFRMAVGVSKSFDMGITITEYSMSIFNSSSIWAPFSDTARMNNSTSDIEAGNYRTSINTSFIIQTFYGEGILPFNLALDCQPLLNNFVNQRTNANLMDVDYNYQSNTVYFSSSLAPVNFLQILSGSAARATVPESNYSQLKSIIPRYNGAKSTSQQLNVWNVGDTGTFGKLPTVELRDAYFGYFNDLDDPYPNINGLTRVNLNYLIDEQGNALPPSLDPLSIDTFEQVFPTTTLAKIAPKTGKNNFRVLGTPAPVSRLMQYLTPIMYSQNAGNNYTNIIPLSGSGYISRYDNDDEGSQVFSRFNALGATSVDTSVPVQEVDYTLDPTSTVTTPTVGNTFNPYDVDDSGGERTENGVSFFPLNEYPGTSRGDDLPNEQIISMQTTFVTSYVSETGKTRDELSFELHMYTGSITVNDPTSGYSVGAESSFNIEDITCNVYTDDGRVTSLGSILDYGWFKMTNIVDYERKRKKRRRGLRKIGNSRWIYSYVPVPTGGIVCTVDWEMFETLFDLGLMRKRKPSNGAGVLALEWGLKANSGVTTIKVDDAISWRIKGSFKKAQRKRQQGLFFPLGYDGQYTTANIEGVGAYDHLLDEANTASAPFWVFSGSSGTSSPTIIDQQFLVMSSSNMNEAYGESFKQADLEYFPSPSPYFPGGIEPSTTRFDIIENVLELQINDEIRFANNENFTYTVEQVFPPQANNRTPDGKNRLKIKLNKPVDTSVNKDFFLVRRPVINPNSLYLEQPFPYDSLASASISTISFGPGSSGSFALTGSQSLPSGSEDDGSYTGSLSNLEIATTPGILYPDFPTEYLVQSASAIVNDLISKGIIES